MAKKEETPRWKKMIPPVIFLLLILTIATLSLQYILPEPAPQIIDNVIELRIEESTLTKADLIADTDDLIDAIILSLTTNNFGGEVFQIASSSETTIGELKDLIIAELIQQGIKGTSVKNVLKRVGDVQRNYSDTSKAYNQLGWKPKVNLKNGISKTVSYFLNKLYKIDN